MERICNPDTSPIFRCARTKLSIYGVCTLVKFQPDRAGNAIKRKLIAEFNTMKLIEQDAHDFHVKVSTHPDVTEPEIRNCFRRIAEEEKYHMELVDRIMKIIHNCV